ncbi:MAG: hypothetical protein EHM78_12180 [Myxococcaceae bacterium]|nr:MAG: hypothetical protein EHM78_12180 [Myxococcaceae bacterium]
MTFLLMALLMGGTPKLEVDPTGHFFTSAEGVEVALAAVRSPGPKRALVRITRAGANPASKVWLAQVWERLEISEYTVTVEKKEHRLLITRAGFPVVYLPEDGREVSISWNEEKSRALDTQQLLEEYLRQGKTKK